MRKKAFVKQYMQYRAEDLKSLTEQRADLVQQMKELTSTAETEKRAFSPEEDTQFDELDKQVKALDSTIEKMERARDMKLNITSTEKHEELEKEELEERAFAAFTMWAEPCQSHIMTRRHRVLKWPMQRNLLSWNPRLANLAVLNLKGSWLAHCLKYLNL